MGDILTLIQSIRAILWGVPSLFLIVGVGIYLTSLLRGMQFRYLLRGVKMIAQQEEKDQNVQGEISPFQSLMTAIASAVGTGSIVGVATAICTGGLGAVFWMWVSTLIIMVVKYSESLLAVRYRGTDEKGAVCGGPMYYIERGLGWKWLAVLYAIFASIAAIGTGNLVQINSIVGALNHIYGFNPLAIGAVLMVFTGYVLFRGIKRISYVSSVLVPIMALFYVAAGAIVLFVFREHLPSTLSLIFQSAFTGQAAAGGFLGSTMMMAIEMGFARSVHSSEAGLGISSIAAAAARTTSSAQQALLSMTATVVGTALVCTVSALVIAVTGVLGQVDANGQLINGSALAIAAFSAAMPGGQYIVAIGLILFSFTTVIAWAYYGEKCFEYLFGAKSIIFYRIVYTLLVIPGAMFALDLVWAFADVMNALMVIPNMIAILALSGVIQKETKEFLQGKAKAAKATKVVEELVVSKS